MKRLLWIGALACLVPLAGCGDDDGDTDTTDDDMGMSTEDMGSTDEDMGSADEDMGSADEDMGTTADEDMGTTAMGDFTLNLTRFNPHNGQDVTYSLRDSSGAEVATETDSVMGGSLSFTATGVIDAGETYRVSFFADINANDACDAPPTDHVWQLTGQTPDGSGDLTVAYQHDTSFTPAACDDLP